MFSRKDITGEVVGVNQTDVGNEYRVRIEAPSALPNRLAVPRAKARALYEEGLIDSMSQGFMSNVSGDIGGMSRINTQPRVENLDGMMEYRTYDVFIPNPKADKSEVRSHVQRIEEEGFEHISDREVQAAAREERELNQEQDVTEEEGQTGAEEEEPDKEYESQVGANYKEDDTRGSSGSDGSYNV